MKQIVIALLVSASLAMPVQAKNNNDPLISFLFGAIIGNAISNNSRPNPRPRPRVVTYCIDKVWVPAQRVWIARHWENNFYISGHYKSRGGYYEQQRYRC